MYVCYVRSQFNYVNFVVVVVVVKHYTVCEKRCIKIFYLLKCGVNV